MLKSVTSLLIFLLVLTSCGYKSGMSKESQIAFSSVEGDWEGLATAEVMKALNRSGFFSEKGEGKVILQVAIEEENENNIGFRYGKDKDLNTTKSLVASEQRLEIGAKVSLLDNETGKVILGPHKLKAHLDYDFDATQDNFSQESLGQLLPEHLARKEAYNVIYCKLAEEIINYLNTAVW